MMIKTAKVTAIEDNKIKVHFSEDATPSTLLYSKLKSYTPLVGDTVLMLKTSTSYICLGGVG